jgi:hypothetical protein
MVYLSPGLEVDQTVDGEVAVEGAAAHLDGLVGLIGLGGVVQQVAYVPGSGC